MDTSIFLMVGSISVAVALDILLLCKVYISGKSLRRVRISAKSLIGFDSESVLPFVEARHLTCVKRFLWGIFLTVIFLEVMIRMVNGWDDLTNLFDTPLGVIHFALDVYFVGLLVDMRFFRTGHKNPTMHRKLFKRVLYSFILIFVTGSWLLYDLVSSQ